MNSPDSGSSQYTVVARRYRPQAFDDMVGQNHIAHALTNAIKQNRVGHAYLFTGARGVGKTSSARIFAKCLNCQKGPSGEPCNECDVCTSVSVGEDIDVLEIDGASNRGIDEIRQLRSNAIVRPSRATFKIYIIDEVHMLTQQAFNALLKTLEEPPDHVKFIFCTTDPQKIPITVLSRCQRFDFSPVQTPDIIQRLQEICDNEKIEVDEQSLAVLARRAAGSMRDSQSLLEQLLSFCSEKISIEDVHQLLGTADMGRIATIVQAIIDRQTAECLDAAAAAIVAGVDAGQLATQLLGYFRDIMAVRVGASPDTLLSCDASDLDSLKQQAEALGLETTLAILQVLDRCITKMQSSLHGRTLLEVAIVRVCQLERLDLIADLVDQLGSPTASTKSSGSAVKKNAVARVDPPQRSVAPSSTPPGGSTISKAPGTSDSSVSSGADASDGLPAPANVGAVSAVAGAVAVAATSSTATAQRVALTDDNVLKVWQEATREAGGVITDAATQFKKIKLENGGLVVTFAQKHLYEFCHRSDRSQALAAAVEKVTGNQVRLDFRLEEAPELTPQERKPRLTRVQRIRQLEQNEFVKQAMEVFDAEVVDFLDPPPSK